MNKKMYRENYENLRMLMPNLHQIVEPVRLSSRGFADLNVELLERKKEHLDLLLSRNFERNFDQILPDPDIAVRVYPKARTAKALTFQDIYDDHRRDSEKRKFDLRSQNLNQFLSFWLRNLVDQGHRPVE